MKRVWVTRARPGAEETAGRVRALGLDALVDPLLEVRAVGEGSVDLGDAGALAFTSANAVRAFAVRSARRDLPVFAVGAATARAAADAGFARTLSAGGDVAALGRLIVARRAAILGAVLHPSAAEPAGDLVGDLTAAGISARRLPLYETQARSPAADTAGLLERGAIVLVHSPRAARVLVSWLAGRDAARLLALCLSPAVAAALGEPAPVRQRVVAAPDEAAMMAALADEALRD